LIFMVVTGLTQFADWRLQFKDFTCQCRV